jgi:hypothetical protein
VAAHPEQQREGPSGHRPGSASSRAHWGPAARSRTVRAVRARRPGGQTARDSIGGRTGGRAAARFRMRRLDRPFRIAPRVLAIHLGHTLQRQRAQPTTSGAGLPQPVLPTVQRGHFSPIPSGRRHQLRRRFALFVVKACYLTRDRPRISRSDRLMGVPVANAHGQVDQLIVGKTRWERRAAQRPVSAPPAGAAAR